MLPVQTLEEAQLLAQAIVNTIPEPFLVLGADLAVLAASRSFYDIFQVDPAQTQGCQLYALGNGQWDIPALRLLLETIIPDQVAMDDFEVDHDFPVLGRRVMLLNARQVVYDDSAGIAILLAFRDVTDRRAIEQEKEALLHRAEDLLHQNRLLLEEMRHRVANSLQIIASILLLKARAVASDDTRSHLKDAHSRVMSVAAVQEHLHMTDSVDQVEVATYLQKLCGGLASSMVGESQPVTISVSADTGRVLSAKAVSLGLIVTELVINALKYAFPRRREGATIHISYEIASEDWRLTVTDNGVGHDAEIAAASESGLGTTIVKSLARQLGASVETVSSPNGYTAVINRATFTSCTQSPD